MNPNKKRPDSWDIELSNIPIKADTLMMAGAHGSHDEHEQNLHHHQHRRHDSRSGKSPQPHGQNAGHDPFHGLDPLHGHVHGRHPREPLYEEPDRPKVWRRVLDSFKRDPNSTFRNVIEGSDGMGKGNNGGGNEMYGWPRGDSGTQQQQGHYYHRAPVMGVTAAEPYRDDVEGGHATERRRNSSVNTVGGMGNTDGSGGGGGGGWGGHEYDIHMATMQTAHTALARKLKGRHLQMIAMGGSIGTGLFVASGKALATGGPASLVIAFSLVGVMLYCTVQALGELAVIFPVAGSFSAYSTRFLDPSWGFAMGWNYAMQWLVVLPLEIIAASLTIGYWDEEVTRAPFVTVFLGGIITINLLGVRGYGEAEYIFAMIKVIAVIGFILLGIVLNIGGTPTGGYIGASFWISPGAFNNGFRGLCSVFVTAAFAFAGTELVGLAAAETANPRKSLPTAIKQVFWRITLFYIVALLLVGLLVRHDDDRLIGGPESSSVDAKTSPFVIAIENAGIDILPSVMNAVILIAVLSVGNSAVFGSSRTLAALADQSQAPRIFAYVDRKGRPLVAILLASSVGFLSYLADLRAQQVVLDWMLAISGLSSIFTWSSICLAHIRFRSAWQYRNRRLDSLSFRAQSGVLGSYIGLCFNGLVLVAQFWTGLWPVGYEGMTKIQIAENFFLAYLAAPIILMFYGLHKFYYGTSVVGVEDMDIDTGRRDLGVNLQVVVAQEEAEKEGWPGWKRVYKFLC